jgi:hypothetical protein
MHCWLAGNVSTSVLIVFVNKLVMKNHKFHFGARKSPLPRCEHALSASYCQLQAKQEHCKA